MEEMDDERPRRKTAVNPHKGHKEERVVDRFNVGEEVEKESREEEGREAYTCQPSATVDPSPDCAIPRRA